MLRPPPPSRKFSGSKRTSQSSSLSPPPPYVNNDDFSFDKPLKDIDTSDPIRATAMMLGVQLDSDPELFSTMAERIAEKSREELANLFLEAEKVIRARETELVLAANLGKTLLETNQALKLRYDALLARLPVSTTSGSSPNSPSRAPFVKLNANCTSDGEQWTTDEEVTFRIPSATPSPIRSRANSSGTLDTYSLAHHRRISASPAAVITLQETNNELITELTRLQSETDEAQVEGAQRLRKLEQEIKGLKAELETTHRTNAELEARMHTQRNDEQSAPREKRARLSRQINPSSQDHDDDTLQPHHDFAPPPELQKRLRKASSIDICVDEFEHTCPNYEESVASDVSSVHSTFSAVSAGEYAVVSQLYEKVEELQTANRELAARNRATKEQLSRAERNALELKKVYDAIRVELGSDADTDDVPSHSGDEDDNPPRGDSRLVTPKTSMRSIGHFATRSNGKNELVRSRRGSKAKRPERQMDSDKPMMPSGSSISRAIGNKNMLNATRLAKGRKPLPASFRPSSFPAQLPKSLPCSRSSSPVPTDSAVLITPRSQTPTMARGKGRGTVRHSTVTTQRTLGSELADKLNSADLGNLSSFTNIPDSIHIGGSSTAALVDEDFPAVAELRRLLDEDEFLNSVSPNTSVSAKPYIVLNSPGISRVASMDTRSSLHHPFMDSLTSSPTAAQRRISRREGALRRMVSTRENEFLPAAESVAHSLMEDTFSEENESDGQDQYLSASSTPHKGVLRQLRRHSEEIMLELWIYLQFIVVVGFFLYTMYKRGPRDVMGLPPRK